MPHTLPGSRHCSRHKRGARRLGNRSSSNRIHFDVPFFGQLNRQHDSVRLQPYAAPLASEPRRHRCSAAPRRLAGPRTRGGSPQSWRMWTLQLSRMLRGAKDRTAGDALQSPGYGVKSKSPAWIAETNVRQVCFARIRIGPASPFVELRTPTRSAIRATSTQDCPSAHAVLLRHIVSVNPG
jgi:hypothetical protein